jgi:hypothetical protein
MTDRRGELIGHPCPDVTDVSDGYQQLVTTVARTSLNSEGGEVSSR